jgi:hypothetical protein
VRYKLRPSHPPRFHYPNNIWWRVQIMKILIMPFSPASCYFIRFKSKYLTNTEWQIRRNP